MCVSVCGCRQPPVVFVGQLSHVRTLAIPHPRSLPRPTVLRGGAFRMTHLDNALSVVYVPNAGWLGTDTFTYSMVLGTVESAAVEAKVHALLRRKHMRTARCFS